jgi:peroxiredoxin
MPTPQVGERAPDFVLPEASNEMVRLSEEVRHGPVVIAFYPTDWGMICTMEMKRFMEMLDELHRLGARLLAISVNTVTSHRMWKMHLGIEFPLLSDPDGDVVRTYDLLLGETELMRGRSTRAVLIVDRDMIVRYLWKPPHPHLHPDYDGILQALKAL